MSQRYEDPGPTREEVDSWSGRRYNAGPFNARQYTIKANALPITLLWEVDMGTTPSYIDGCTNTVIQSIQAGIPVARCDIVCEKTVAAINKFKKTNYRIAPTVFFEFHGSKNSVVEQAETVQAIAKEHYLQVTAAHFEQAIGEAVHRAVQSPAATSSHETTGETASDKFADTCDMSNDLVTCGVGDEGLEPPTSTL